MFKYGIVVKNSVPTPSLKSLKSGKVPNMVSMNKSFVKNS